MRSASFVMANKRFAYLILASFIAGTVLLLIIQYNFSQNMVAMRKGNESLLRELRTSNHLREIDRDILSVEGRVRAAIATNDTTHLQGTDAKIKAIRDYLDSLNKSIHDAETKKFLKRLSLLADEKVKVKNTLISRYLRLGNMNDTSLIANPYARRTSNEITDATHKIYDNRQKMMNGLSKSVIRNSEQARLYGNLLMVFMFLSGGVLCWFIVNQFRQQNRLIIKLNASEQTAREALQIKENFLANMSHEIRTPLNAILGFTNLLKRRKIDADADEFVDSIQKAGENLLAIINDILDLSKIEAGMMRIVSAPFSVSGLFDSVETLFQEKVKEKGLVFSTTIDAQVPDTLIGDATRLTQIMVNLIGNALKFSDNGEIKVAVYTQQISGKIIHLGIRVTDSGIGISKEKLAAIFERFNQAEDSITRSYGGTGLGLSIVKDLVILQHGNIEVKSEPGKGTEFSFYIPYTIADEQITDNRRVNITKNKISAGLTILVVDDNTMNQSLMGHLLQQWNAVFDIVANGEEAISQLQLKPYDLVLMDIQMPKMDGYTATYHIRTGLKLKVPIIAMTAHAMAGEREKCLSHGMNGYIAKPINEEELFRLVTKFAAPKLASQNVPASIAAAKGFNVIDLTYMKEISKGNTMYEQTVTSQFMACIPADLSGLKAAYHGKDYQALNRIAHNMKTSVAIMGLLPQLEQPLDILEAANADNPGIPNIITQVQTICTQALKEAELFYATLKAE